MTKPTQGHNMNGLLKEIKEGVDSVIQLKKERAEINASIAEVRSRMEAKGIKKKAFDAALRYLEQDEEQREGYDMAYAIARKAVGLPMQGDLFEDEVLAQEGEAA